MATLAQPITIEAFDHFVSLPENLERHFELIDGTIVEKPMPTQLHARITAIFVGEIYIFLKVHPIGHVETEARYRPIGDKKNDRLPDVSFTSSDKPAVSKGAAPGMPDLAIEVMSPDDKLRDLRAKAKFSIANGVRLVWLVLPEQKIVEVYRPNEDVQLLTVENTLDGYDVLPGFSLAIAEIFKV